MLTNPFCNTWFQSFLGLLLLLTINVTIKDCGLFGLLKLHQFAHHDCVCLDLSPEPQSLNNLLKKRNTTPSPDCKSSTKLFNNIASLLFTLWFVPILSYIITQLIIVMIVRKIENGRSYEQICFKMLFVHCKLLLFSYFF